jgi:hypothetical protein
MSESTEVGFGNIHLGVYAVQGGGHAIWKDGQYVWYDGIPSFVNAQIGDPIPEEWGVAAINEAAHEEAAREHEEELLELEEAAEQASLSCGTCGGPLASTGPRARDGYCSDDCYRLASSAADEAADNRYI